MILESLNVFGWSETHENMLLASLVTGDPVLIIGKKGSAKTQAATVFAKAMNYRISVYDAAKALFEDVLGYPDIEKLKTGVIDYISSPITVWDKDFVVIDEINRALPEMQNKWLEIIRSRRIMGKDTCVKWVWSCMNPESYAGANTLDEAMVDRFAAFIFPPNALDMNDEHRAKIANAINTDDAPALRHWIEDFKIDQVARGGEEVKRVIEMASRFFVSLRKDFSTIPDFLARYVPLIMRESRGAVELTGRRMGFIARNIIAFRSVELAKSAVYKTRVNPLRDTIREVLVLSIPCLAESELPKLRAVSDSCFMTLGSYFEKGGDISAANRAYTMLVTSSMDTLLTELCKGGLNEVVACRAWKRLVEDCKSMNTRRAVASLISEIVLRIEAIRPGFVPAEMIPTLHKSALLNDTPEVAMLERSDEMARMIDRLHDRYGARHKSIVTVLLGCIDGKDGIDKLEERAIALGDKLEALLDGKE